MNGRVIFVWVHQPWKFPPGWLRSALKRSGCGQGWTGGADCLRASLGKRHRRAARQISHALNAKHCKIMSQSPNWSALVVGRYIVLLEHFSHQLFVQHSDSSSEDSGSKQLQVSHSMRKIMVQTSKLCEQSDKVTSCISVHAEQVKLPRNQWSYILLLFQL